MELGENIPGNLLQLQKSIRAKKLLTEAPQISFIPTDFWLMDDCPLSLKQIKMTEKAPEPHLEEDDDELDGKLNYKPPPQKSLKELQEMDKDDESLIKYKKTLLGDGPVVAGVCVRGWGSGGGSQIRHSGYSAASAKARLPRCF